MDFNFDVGGDSLPVKKGRSVKVAKRSALADRGKVAEKKAAEFGKRWADNHSNREFNRLLDTKAAKRIVRAAPADFEFFCLEQVPDGVKAFSGLIEAKQTEHEYRLQHSKVPQLAGMAHRSRCGSKCLVLVYHSTLDRWRVIDALVLMSTKEGASWDLTQYPLFGSVREALEFASPVIFR